MNYKYTGLAFIGEIAISKKTYSNRVDDTYQTLIGKISFFLKFCKENELMPVCVGSLFSKNISFNVFWDMYQEYFEKEQPIICLGDNTQDDIYRKLKENKTLRTSFTKLIARHKILLPELVSNSDVQKGEYIFVLSKDLIGNKVELVEDDSEDSASYQVTLGSILRSKAIDKKARPSFICINKKGINQENISSDKDVFINNSDVDNEFSFFAERLSQSVSRQESLDENNLPHYIETVTETNEYDSFVVDSVKNLYQERDTTP